MKKLKLFAVVSLMLAIASCSVDPGMKVKSMPVIISEGFTSETEYEVVCIGYPKDGLTGLQKELTAKEAAVINAQYYLKNKFDDTIRPEMDGDVADFKMVDDHAQIKYVLKKSDLKKRLKK